jgi:SAM-dependent methyltransferase
MSDRRTQARTASERRRLEWTERMERYAQRSAPRLRPFAAALVNLLPPPAGGRILDVATGTGLVAVEAARRVGPDGTVLATDFLAAWELHVRNTAAEAGVTNITFAAMPAEALDLPAASFDVVYCQFGLMFVPEQDRALREMRRMLRPGGRIGIAVWSVPENVGLFLVSRIVGPALPPVEGEAPPSPMGMGAPGLIEGLMAEAGLSEIVTHRVTLFHEIADPETEWAAWCEDFATPDGGGLASLPESEQQRLHDEVIAALERLRDGDVVRVPSEAIVVTATR